MISAPQRIQLRRSKGWRLPAGAVVVSRPTRWGNPYRVGVHGTAAKCVAAYRLVVFGPGSLIVTGGGRPGYGEQERLLRHARAHIAELRGKDLACWCALDEPCHADVLLELANRAETAPSDSDAVGQSDGRLADMTRSLLFSSC